MNDHRIITLTNFRIRIEWEVESSHDDNEPDTSHIHLGFCLRHRSEEVWSGSYEADWLDETPHRISQADEAKVHAAVEDFVDDNPDPA